MKFKTTLLSVCFLFLPLAIFAQLSQDTRENLPTREQYKKMTKYQTILNLRNKTTVRGLLFRVTDEQVIIIPRDDKIKDYSHFVNLVRDEQIPVNIPFISRVGTKKKGKMAKSLLIGIGIGLALGSLGASNADSDDLITNDIITIPVLTGGLLGLLIGSISKSHDLNDKAELEKLKGLGIMPSF